MVKFLGLFLLLSTVICCSSAFAEFEFVARGAAGVPTSNFSFVSTPSPMIAADLTYGMSDYFQMGATYDHNFFSYKNGGGNGSETFYGAIARFGFFSGTFVDFQGGLCSRDSSDTSFSWGAGLGYAMSVSPWVDFSPRFGYRSLPDGAVTRSMVDFGAMLTFKLF